ncbi:MAG: mechanosensitive ion channel [Chloroflexota bacterium]
MTFGPSAMSPQLEKVLSFIRVPLEIVVIIVAFIAALIIIRLSFRFAGWLIDAANVATVPQPKRSSGSESEIAASARRTTLQQLVASLIGFTAFTTAILFALSHVMSLSSLALIATVLANAFGFAARDYVGDLLNGISNLFEDRFDVGDNVEIVRLEDELRGVIENVNIRTIGIRTRGGELVIVPQGQVRILKNFTRGAFTGTDVTVAVPAVNLAAAMQLLIDLGLEAPNLLTDLTEPWRVISQEGEVNAVSELAIYAKAAYGRGANLRLEIMSLVQQRLEAAGIPLAG